MDRRLKGCHTWYKSSWLVIPLNDSIYVRGRKGVGGGGGGKGGGGEGREEKIKVFIYEGNR